MVKRWSICVQPNDGNNPESGISILGNFGKSALYNSATQQRAPDVHEICMH